LAFVDVYGLAYGAFFNVFNFGNITKHFLAMLPKAEFTNIVIAIYKINNIV
jgi:hypothetical protein